MPTAIEWCDETFNPWWGCERVSPACAHCYADTFAIRLGMSALWPSNIHGNIHGFRFFGDKHWDEPLKWARTLPAKLGRRPRVFCASMADVFEERPELLGPRVRLFRLIESTPQLDWLILTKRPEYALEQFRRSPFATSPLPNVWMGVSIENARFTWRADVLREIPAAVRFISAEPLLGTLFPERCGAPCFPAEGSYICGRAKGHAGVHRSEYRYRPDEPAGCEWDGEHAWVGRRTLGSYAKPLDLSGIDWVIIGGESGPKARPFHLEHAREIIRAGLDECADCRALGGEYVGRLQWKPEFIDDHTHWAICGRTTAVFVKQLGAKPSEPDPVDGEHGLRYEYKLRDRKGGAIAEWPADLRIREFPQTAVHA